jgi:hypothetical protein
MVFVCTSAAAPMHASRWLALKEVEAWWTDVLRTCGGRGCELTLARTGSSHIVTVTPLRQNRLP